MEASSAETHAHLGRVTDESQDYEASDEYADQGETRTVKNLLFTYMVIAPSPMIPGEEIIMEKMAHRGDEIPLSELGTYYLALGEKSGAFFTDDELKIGAHTQPAGAIPAPIAPAEGEGINVSFQELGSHEMAEYLEANKPNVQQTLALVGNDKEAAKRLLEAENIVTDNDPRAGVEKGVEQIVSGE